MNRFAENFSRWYDAEDARYRARLAEYASKFHVSDEARVGRRRLSKTVELSDGSRVKRLTDAELASRLL